MDNKVPNPSMENTLLHCLEQAEERGVYIEYRLEGEGTLTQLADTGTNTLLEALLLRLVDDCAGHAESDRWLSLQLDQQDGTLEIAGPGNGPDPPPGKDIVLIRYGDSFRLRLKLKRENGEPIKKNKYREERV